MLELPAGLLGTAGLACLLPLRPTEVRSAGRCGELNNLALVWSVVHGVFRQGQGHQIGVRCDNVAVQQTGLNRPDVRMQGVSPVRMRVV